MPCQPGHTQRHHVEHGPGLDEYLGTEMEQMMEDDPEQSQQAADHMREVEKDRQMVTDDPPPVAFPGVKIGLGLPYVHGVEQHRVLNYNYWNANGRAMCIAAVEGHAADWAAYIGADGGWRTEECVEWTIRKGCKLSRDQANRWFPELPIEAYRE